MSYSRSAPSPRFQALLELHHKAHQVSASFPGYSIGPFIGMIKALVLQSGSRSLLDYGCGAGHQYRKVGVRVLGRFRFFLSLARYWGVEVTGYDPAVARYARLPTWSFDAVISTDVLEHLDPEDVPWVLDEIFSKAARLVFLKVDSDLAWRTLPDGSNAHSTVREGGWWKEQVEGVARRYPALRYCLVVTSRGRAWTEQVYSNERLPPLQETARLFPIWGGWLYFLKKKAQILVRT